MRLGVLTIPRLPEVRSDEFSLSQVLGHLHMMARMLAGVMAPSDSG